MTVSVEAKVRTVREGRAGGLDPTSAVRKWDVENQDFTGGKSDDRNLRVHSCGGIEENAEAVRRRKN